MSRPVGSKKSVWIGGAPGFWGALTMMVALVFGVLLLCSGITTAQTASPPANENLADSQAINSAAAIPTYTIKDLGTLPDYPDSFATDVDDKGRVAGYAHNFTTGNTQAFLYEGGQMQDLDRCTE